VEKGEGTRVAIMNSVLIHPNYDSGSHKPQAKPHISTKGGTHAVQHGMRNMSTLWKSSEGNA